MNNAASAASEFAQGMAEVNTLLAGDDPVRLARLSAQVRETAVDLGATLPDATQSLYNILSAGVPEGNAIEVLQQSTRAAIAGVTDTNTAARGGLAVINAYDRGVDELSDVFDVLFSTVRRGVTTLPELTQNLGQVLPIAAAADVPFEELAGAVARLTQVGVRTPQATTALRGAIVGLQTPTEAARKAMDELGIEWDGLLGTLEQISALDLAAEELREIIPEVEGRLAVLALADNMDGLRDSIEGMSSSAGATDAAYAKMADTPEQRMRRFSAVLADIRVDLGDMVLQGVLPAAEALGSLAQTVAGLPAEFRVMLGLIAGITLAQAAWAIGLRQAYNALRLAAAGTLTLNNATRLLLRGVPLAVLAGTGHHPRRRCSWNTATRCSGWPSSRSASAKTCGPASRRTASTPIR
ncbi:MAG: phage tail tape measure protein [Gammaproteobacteria bacterium]|nr:phage tail tape measure protein [Gammaproteobacteria bacterium]